MKGSTKNIILLFFIGLMIVCSFSFQKKKEEPILTKKERMELILEERLTKYRLSFIDNCRQDALEDAMAHVDSIIRTPGLIFKHDSIVPPRPPSKPSKPNIGEGQFKEVKPIFQ